MNKIAFSSLVAVLLVAQTLSLQAQSSSSSNSTSSASSSSGSSTSSSSSAASSTSSSGSGGKLCTEVQGCVDSAVSSVAASCIASLGTNCAIDNGDKFAITAGQLARRAIDAQRCANRKTKGGCNACYQLAKVPLTVRVKFNLFKGMLAQSISLIDRERKEVCAALK